MTAPRGRKLGMLVGVLAILTTLVGCEPKGVPGVHYLLPLPHQVFAQGGTAIADFWCDDDNGGPVVDCVGSVPDGSPIDTSTNGSFTFEITITYGDGTSDTERIPYHVVPATRLPASTPAVSIATPEVGAVYTVGQAVDPDPECSFSRCSQGPPGGPWTVMYNDGYPPYPTLDTSTPGLFVLRVNGGSVHSYRAFRVVDGPLPPAQSPPSVTVQRPTYGSAFAMGSEVTVVYTCAAGSSPVDYCGEVDTNLAHLPTPVPGFAKLDTSTPGWKTLHIAAEGDSGAEYEAVTYYVLDPALAARITNGDGDSRDPSVSADGRYVAFSSVATNLVPGDGNGVGDIFVWDRVTGTTERITDGPLASGDPDISGDGSLVVYEQGPDVFIWDRATGTSSLVADSASAALTNPSISANGWFVAFDSSAGDLVAGDGNGVSDVFVVDRQTATIERIPTPAGASTDPDISGTGRYVAYNVNQSGMSVRRWDRDTLTLATATAGIAGIAPQITDDGSLVATATGLLSPRLWFVDDGVVRNAVFGPSCTCDGFGVSADGQVSAVNGILTGGDLQLLAAQIPPYSGPSWSLPVFWQSGKLAAIRQAGTFSPTLPMVLSADGDLVAAAAVDSTAFSGDTNGKVDIFVKLP